MGIDQSIAHEDRKMMDGKKKTSCISVTFESFARLALHNPHNESSMCLCAYAVQCKYNHERWMNRRVLF